MTSTASFRKHPLHPIIIPLPIGLWIFSLAADIIYMAGGGDVWAYVALYSMAGGIIGAVFAVIPGFIDLFSMNPSRVRSIGILHMSLNIAALLIFIIDALLRNDITNVGIPVLILSIIGVVLIGISGWFGGELVYRYRVAVNEESITDKAEHYLKDKIA
jgi:uncharacterized membrane protein